MHRKRGFTLIEVAIVLMIAGLLTSITVSAFGSVQKRYSVRQAKNALVTLHARARANAIEFGQSTHLLISTAGDSMWITRNDTTLEKIRLQDELMVDIQGTSSFYRLCMNTRGYGDDGCNSFAAPVTLRLVSRAGTDTATVQMLPLGQLLH